VVDFYHVRSYKTSQLSSAELMKEMKQTEPAAAAAEFDTW
jgi:hypothetical protein